MESFDTRSGGAHRGFGPLLAVIIAGSCLAPPQAGANGQQVSFEWVKNQIVIAVEMAGKGPFSMLVDTGTIPSVIDLELAETLGYRVDQEKPVVAAGSGDDVVHVFPTRIEGLRIDNVDYGAIYALASSRTMPAFSRRLGREIHGVLGTSFLHGKVVAFDYPRWVLVIDGPVPDRDQPGTHQFPLVTPPGDIMPVLEVAVADRPLRVTLDTGSSLGLVVYTHARDAAGLARVPEGWEVVDAMGYRGAFQMPLGTLGPIRVGPFAVERVDAALRPGSRKVDGNAGNELLRHFRVTIDYVEKTVTLQRSAPDTDRVSPQE